MTHLSKLAAAALLSFSLLSACTPPNATPSNSPSAAPSTAPSSTPSTAPSTTPSTAPSNAATPSAAPSGTPVEVDTSMLSPYFKTPEVGQKWVYKLTIAQPQIDLGAITGGLGDIKIPGLGFSVQQLGGDITFSREIIDISGDKITERVRVSGIPGGDTVNEETYDINNRDESIIYAPGQTSMRFEKASSNESVSVPAGTFNADKFKIYLKVKDAATGVELDQVSDSWISKDVGGMVKQITESDMSGIKTTTTIELIEFKG